MYWWDQKNEPQKTWVMTPEKYGEQYSDHLLEQYKIYVEMTDRVTQRKEQTNRLYVTLFSALIAAFSFAISSLPENLAFQIFPGLPIVAIVVGMAGILLAMTWFLNLYVLERERLAKSRTIVGMESQLAFPAFQREGEISIYARSSPVFKLSVFRLYRPDYLLPWIFLAISTLLYGTSFLWLQ